MEIEDYNYEKNSTQSLKKSVMLLSTGLRELAVQKV